MNEEKAPSAPGALAWPECAWARAAIVVAAVAIAGCSALERGTGKVVAASLEAVNEQGNRSRVEEILTSDEIRDATRELTGVVLDTALGDLTEQQRRERIREVAVEFVEELTPVLAETFDAEVWPGVKAKLEESVAATLDQVLSDETLERARRFTADTAREVVEATAPDLVATVSAGLANGLETGFAAVLRDQVVPALEDFAGRDHGPAVRSLARDVSHGAFLGLADAMNGELGEVYDRERDEILDRLDSRLVEEAGKVAWRLKAALVAAGVLLVVGLILLVLLRRGQRRRDQALDLLLSELRRQDGETLNKVRESGRSTEGGKYLERRLSRSGGS